MTDAKTDAKPKKIRLFELAKELGVTAKALGDKLKSQGIMGLSNFTALDDPIVHKARSLFGKLPAKPTGEPAAAKPGAKGVAPATPPSAAAPAAPEAPRVPGPLILPESPGARGVVHARGTAPAKPGTAPVARTAPAAGQPAAPAAVARAASPSPAASTAPTATPVAAHASAAPRPVRQAGAESTGAAPARPHTAAAPAGAATAPRPTPAAGSASAAASAAGAAGLGSAAHAAGTTATASAAALATSTAAPVAPGQAGETVDADGVRHIGRKTIFKVVEEPRPTRAEEARRRHEAAKAVPAAPAPAEAPKEVPRPHAHYKKDRGPRRDEVAAPPAPPEKVIQIDAPIVVSDLAKALGVSAVQLVTKLISLGTMASINQRIDFETASILAAEFGTKVESVPQEEGLEVPRSPDPEGSLKPRSPVVTIMGHVDHGKTSLLDAIRNTDVASGEAGGITQHIGAYQVPMASGQSVTFLDTPGHEAFTAMRAQGANVTDIAILVVAADDGVMPQTEEAIHHAQAAGVPIIVAINKVDKPGANPDKVKQQLTAHQLVAVEWGGKTEYVNVSAKTRQGIPDLLETIVLQAAMMELKANPDKGARGVIIEAKVDKGKGPVATALVKEGTLHVGDIFVCGTTWGRVRAMATNRNPKIREATPGVPVEVMGIDGLPEVADELVVVPNEAQAKEVAAKRQQRKKIQTGVGRKRLSLDDIFKEVQEGKAKELKIIIKADMQGSATALKDSLEKLGEEVKVAAIHTGVGAISETDVMFAAASNAVILGFHVRPSTAVQKLGTQEGVDIRLYSVIYQAIDDVKAALKGMLAPKTKEVNLGSVEVRKVFSIPKVGRIAGCYVTDGKVTRNAQCRLVRDGVEVYSGKIGSLRRFKDDAREVMAGYECGVGLENFTDLKEKDVIEVYTVETIPA